MLKEQLLSGKPVIYRSSGWSLYPRAYSNDQCHFDPVSPPDEVRHNDVVFCEVQPGDRFFAHLVSRKWGGERRVVFYSFQYEGEAKRLVLHEAHIRPIGPS